MGTRIVLGKIPSVMTHAIAEYTVGLVMVSERDTPRAEAVEVAAGSSYVMAPITLNLIHGRGRPRNFDKVNTPNSIEIAGAIVNIAEEVIVFLSFFASIPISFPRLYALIKKNRD
jgi:hypothetical protein